MDIGLIVSNILNSAILFFPGNISCFVNSDLEIPAPLLKFLSLYLLLAIGFKRGVELSKSGIISEVLLAVAAAMLIACLVPV